MKVLVVDDSVATLDSTKALLELSHAAVVVYTAANLKAAMLQLEQRPEINLVISDYYLPGGNGLLLCSKIRQMGRNMPIMILTAAASELVETVREACEKMNNVMVFRKPLDPEAFIAIVSGMKAPSGTVNK